MSAETDRQSLSAPPPVVVMGVSGSGKTAIGSALAEAIGGRFMDGDHFHPPENIRRMADGMPLRDEDRWAWLDAIAAEISRAKDDPRPLVVACSALKRVYRDRLRASGRPILFLHLAVDRDVAAERVAARRGHFMPASLIDSQFADLQPPSADEQAVTLDGTASLAAVVAQAVAAVTARRDRQPVA